MPKQLSEGAPFDLSLLTGFVFAWRHWGQPQLVDVEGQKFVPVFPDLLSLTIAMRSLRVRQFTVKRIEDGADFCADVRNAGVKVCLNLRRTERGTLRYTEIRT